jgi:hypothetical protein
MEYSTNKVRKLGTNLKCVAKSSKIPLRGVIVGKIGTQSRIDDNVC